MTELPRDLYSYIGQNGEANEQIALIEPKWKLIVTGRRITDNTIPRSERETMLFRIASDPYESHNVADEHPEVVNRIWAKLLKFRSLQPPHAVAPYRSRENPFVPLPEWRIPTTRKSAEAEDA